MHKHPLDTDTQSVRVRRLKNTQIGGCIGNNNHNNRQFQILHILIMHANMKPHKWHDVMIGCSYIFSLRNKIKKKQQSTQKYVK